MNISDQTSTLELEAFAIEHFTSILNQGLEEGYRLLELHQTLEHYKTQPLNSIANAIAIEMVNCKIDYINNMFGFNYLALETINDGRNQLELASESVSGVIKKVWDSIIKLVKFLWTKIKQFFSKMKDFLFGAEKKLDAIEQKVENIPDDAKPVQKPALEKTAEELPFFAEALFIPDHNLIDYISANKHINLSSRLVDYLNEALRTIIGGTRKIFNPSSSAEEIREAYNELQEKVSESLIDTLPVHKSVKKGDYNMKVLGPIVGQHYIAANDDVSDKGEQFFEIFQEPKTIPDVSKIKILSKQEMLKLIAALKYAINTNNKVMSGITDNTEVLNKECQKVADNMSRSSSENDIQKQIKTNVKSCLDFSSDCLRLLQWGVPTTVKAVLGYVDYSCKFYTSERDEDFNEIVKGSKALQKN